MDIKALQLECRFSLAPNSLGYCGQNTAPAKFRECIIDGKCTGVKREVSKFIVLYPYLKTIAKITNLPIFSHKVIESYWIGNELLKKAKVEHYNLLLENFRIQGVPDFFIDELKQKPPKVFIPSHLFQVIHVGVGKASNAVPFNLESINQCMIRWGKVERIKDNKLEINLNSLKQGNKNYQLTTNKESLPFDSKILPNLKNGDTVAVHWNMAIKILTKDEEKKTLLL
ncbi:MAG: DUF6390 family protein, partial [Actinobacteria bacterium]|nr:DUF6390 family protein [Actinomycetota bacterium]